MTSKTQTESPAVLFIDLETSPNITYRWDDLWKPASSNLGQLIEPGRMLCFAAKFHGEKKTSWFGENQAGGHDHMVRVAWELLNATDIIVTYNGDNFDIPWMNYEFLLAGLPKPAPYKSLDFYKVMRQFRLPSKKLEYVSKLLKTQEKLPSGGFDTWTGCLAGDKDAWKDMKRYNLGDIPPMEGMYDDLKSWFPTWFNLNVYQGTSHCCPKCGGYELAREGYAYTSLGKFQRYSCQSCGAWSRDKRNQAVGNVR